MVIDIQEILTILRAEFPNPVSDLDFTNPYELLIAVILSAQTTDAMVNTVTPALFEKYPTPFELALADPKDIEPMINRIGLYRNKSKFIVDAAKTLVEEYDGVIPKTRKQLMTLSGVGRKTANVVLAIGYDIPAIAVDTHVNRVAKGLKMAKADDSVLKVEEKLMRKIPREDWAEAHHLLLLFGRYVATASNKNDYYDLLQGLKEKHKL